MKFPSYSVIASLVLSLAGCENTTEPNNGNDPAHAVNDNRIMRSAALEPCDTDDFKRDVESLPKSAAYLDMLMKHMMQRVQETGGQVFQGFLSPKNFCIAAILTEAEDLNAFAEPSTGRLGFTTGLLLSASSDAEVAAVLGHELAHVTLDHSLELPKHTYSLLWSSPNATRFRQLLLINGLRVHRLRVNFAKLDKIFDALPNAPSEEAVFNDPNYTGYIFYRHAIAAYVLDKNLCADKCAEIRSLLPDIEKTTKQMENSFDV